MYPVNELLNLIVCWTFIYQIYQGANKDTGRLLSLSLTFWVHLRWKKQY